MEAGLALLASFGMAIYVAFSIGANDESMAPLAGSGFIKVGTAALLGGVMASLGAVLLGHRVEETIGRAILTEPIMAVDTFIIVFSMATWMTLASYRGWPISSTHSAVGAAVGLGLARWGLSGVAWSSIGVIVGAWFLSPLAGLTGSMLLVKAMKRALRSRVKGLREQVKAMRLTALLLLLWISLSAFSRGANDIGNASAFLTVMLQQDSLYVRLICSLGMLTGLLLLGRRVIKSVGLNLVKLNPLTALAVQVTVALIMLTATVFGIPLSGTHVLVGAVTGLGLSERSWINVKGLKEIVYTWAATFLASAGISVAVYTVAVRL